MRTLRWTATALAISASLHAGPAAAQATPADFQYARQMLVQMNRDLQRYYYDSTFHGVNLAERFRAVDAQLNTAGTRGELMGILAQFYLDLNDSHTTFIPPGYAGRFNYGWEPLVIGDSVFVARVDSTSDAFRKGLRVGDRVIVIDTRRPTPETMWRVVYSYRVLFPRQTVLLTVQGVDGRRRNMYVQTRVIPFTQRPDLNDPEQRRMFTREREPFVLHVTREFGDSVLLWRMAEFDGDEHSNVDRIIARARSRRALVLDLRDNPGGAQTTLLKLSGYFFDTERDVITIRTRRDSRMLRSRRPDHPFNGTLVILVNSESASSAEIVTRLCQIAGRAVIVGDRSAGMVMRSSFHVRAVSSSSADVIFGYSITDADGIMPDGQRLENHGVVPDSIVLPTGADLAARRDPQLALALAIAGVHLSPEEAGRLYDRPR